MSDGSRKKKHAKDKKLEPAEIKAIMQSVEGRDKFIFTALLYGGMRVGELVHMHKHWIHIDDEYAEDYGSDYINIPDEGEPCSCDECIYNAYIESVRGEGEKSKEWYRVYKKEFFRLKRNNQLPKSLKGVWKPKTATSIRKIPIIVPEFRDELLKFYSKHDSVGISRQQIWSIVKTISMNAINRGIYPHVMRATCASIWADAGLDVHSLMKILGWGTVSTAQIYISASDKTAVEKAIEKSGKFSGRIKA